MSTPANVVALRPTEPSDRLASLLQRRDELEREIALVRAPEATRSAAAASLDAAEAGLRSLDEAERAAWIAWADDTTRPTPAPRADERRDLERRRALAAADLRGATAACDAVETRVISLHGELRQLAGQIYAVRLEILTAQVPEIEALIIDSHKLMIEQLAPLRGLHLALAEEKAAAGNRGDEANSTRLQEAMAKIDSLQKPSTSTNWGVVLARAAEWRQALR